MAAVDGDTVDVVTDEKGLSGQRPARLEACKHRENPCAVPVVRVEG